MSDITRIEIHLDSAAPSPHPDPVPALAALLAIAPLPMISDRPVGAFRAPSLVAGLEALSLNPEGRDVTFAPIQADTLCPQIIAGNAPPLFWSEKDWSASIGRGPSLLSLPVESIPIIAFCESAWSETLKAIDSALSRRAMLAEMSGEGPVRALFFVSDADAFSEQARRFMPYAHSHLIG